MPPQLLTYEELASLIGVSVDDIRGWAQAGWIAPIKTRTRVYFNLDRVVAELRARVAAELTTDSPPGD